MHKNQELAPVIGELRKMALRGASAGELLAFIAERAGDDVWYRMDYLGEAFMQGNFFMLTFAPLPLTEEKEQNWKEEIEEKRETWSEEKLPYLMRLRDYFAFMRVAQQENAYVIVCGADPLSGKWIGRPGVRCYGGRQPIPVCQVAPNDGLLAADPGDERLAAMLAAYGDTLSYDDFVQGLARQGLRVSGADDGYVLVDEQGNRLHHGYRLHGAYDAETDDTLWTPRRGPRLQAVLNRHLGAELVRFGPHDDWELRNDRRHAGPLWGPLLPAIEFGPDQEIRNLLEPYDMTSEERSHVDWSRLYPHHLNADGTVKET